MDTFARRLLLLIKFSITVFRKLISTFNHSMDQVFCNFSHDFTIFWEGPIVPHHASGLSAILYFSGQISHRLKHNCCHLSHKIRLKIFCELHSTCCSRPVPFWLCSLLILQCFDYVLVRCSFAGFVTNGRLRRVPFITDAPETRMSSISSRSISVIP